MPGPVVPGFLPSHPAATDFAALRLIWPQWQGAGYDGSHAMAVAALAGKGDPEVLEHLPTAIDPSRRWPACTTGWTTPTPTSPSGA